MEQRPLEIGQHLRYCDQERMWHDALVLAIHGDVYSGKDADGKEFLQYPCVNLVFVVSNENQTDQYGRQTQKEGATSVMHYEQYAPSGFFWCHPEDEEKAFAKMQEAMKHIKS